MNLRFYCALGLTWLCLTACGGETTVNATDEASIKTSIKAVKETLPKERHKQFEKAVLTVIMGDNPLKELAQIGSDKTKIKELYKKIDGKSAEEIIAMAQDIRAKQAERIAKVEEQLAAERKVAEARRKKQEADRVNNEISELERKLKRHNESRKLLAKFAIVESRLYKPKSRFSYENRIDMKVQNNTGQAISAMSAKAVYKTPSRSVAWYEFDIYFKISGGLEPGESGHWELTPNVMSPAHNGQIHEGAVLTLTLTELEDASGKVLAKADFTKEDEARLQSLKAQVTKN